MIDPTVKFHLLFATATFQRQYDLLKYTQNILEAWPKLKNDEKLYEWLVETRDTDRFMLLDSGVFSTWTLGDEVDIDAYAEYIRQGIIDNAFTAAVGVDVIPGEYGRVPTEKEVIASSEQGWNNFMTLVEDKGLPADKIVHVFHQGEPFSWLEKLMAYNDKLIAEGKEGLYIGLSPANDRTTKQKILWLERCMPFITAKDGSARVKWHGFGVTSFDILRRYPWYTADSTSWMRPGAYGQIRVPLPDKKYIDSKFQVSVTAGSAVSQASRHYGSLSPEEKDWVQQYLKKMELTIEDVAQDENLGVLARQTINIHYFKEVEKELNEMDTRWHPIQEAFI